jgi:Hint domain
MSDSWIALSDGQPEAAGTAGSDLLPRGSLVLELTLPLAGPVVLLDYVHRAGDMGFSVFHDPVRGLILLQRQGRRLLRYVLPEAFPMESGLMRVVYHWDILARTWHLTADPLTGAPPATLQGVDPVAWSLADLVGLCQVGQRHGAVLWYGVTTSDAPPPPRPWIGPRTPVDTPGGPVAAGLLRAGDLVLTADQGALPLRSVTHPQMPGRGAYAPILLRAPYFGQTTDLLVSSEQAICLEGTSVEYLFGEDRVLAPAHHLADGLAAYQDNRRTVVTGVSLDFGQPALITADGCGLMAMTAGTARLPARLLHRFEVTPLLAMQARSGLRPVA